MTSHYSEDTSSDDEALIKSLNAFDNGYESMACAFCDTLNPSVSCSLCHLVWYCDQSCLRRDFGKHRQACMKNCDEEEEVGNEEEVEIESSEEEEEEEIVERKSRLQKRNSVSVRNLNRGSDSVRKSTSLPSDGLGLTSEELRNLVQLSQKKKSIERDAERQGKELAKLQAQVEKLVETSRLSSVNALSLDDFRHSERSSEASIRKLDELQKQLKALELKTKKQMESVPDHYYQPLLNKDDDGCKKYFKLVELDMPIEDVKAKMKLDGVDETLLDRPNEISVNDPGPMPGQHVPLRVCMDPKFKKYFKLVDLSMNVDQIQMKMEADGVDPSLLLQPNAISPNDTGMPMSRPTTSSISSSSSLQEVTMNRLLIKDDPSFQKYFKLIKLGMPVENIQTKMKVDGVDPSLLLRPDDISPNDAGPTTQTGSVSMEQLYALVMQHQQMISQGSFNNKSSAKLQAVHESIEDQMAKEMENAESEFESIFGQEQVLKVGGMSMVQQLEKKSKRELNKKLVEHKQDINKLITELLQRTFADDDDTTKYTVDVSDKLESCGLLLGSTESQTWSAALLIKRKDNGNWHFSEQERMDAGKAYGRLWSMATFTQNVNQLRIKCNQLLNAPSTLMASGHLSKVELIDRYTVLLKESVKLKHKIFQNKQYEYDVQLMEKWGLPKTLTLHRDALTNSFIVLGESTIHLAMEEFQSFDKIIKLRDKKLSSHMTIHIGEKSLQFLGILLKLVEHDEFSVPMQTIRDKINSVKSTYALVQQDEEDDAY